SVGIKSLLNAVSIAATLIDINVAQSKLVLLENFNKNYSKFNAAEGVNAASEEVSTAKLVCTAYLKEFDLLKWDQQVVSKHCIDKTLFITRHKGDILLVQVYVDDIIFGSTKKDLCNAFKKLMHEKFQMSSMGELTFFLELQVQQKKDGIFISQDKYVDEILKKFGFTKVKIASTPMETQKPLLKDENGEEVDVHMYRSTRRLTNIGAFGIQKILLLIWLADSDSTMLRASLDRKSKIGGCQFLGSRLISWQCKKQWLQIPQQKLNMCLLKLLWTSGFGFRIYYCYMKPRKPKRKDTQVPQPSGPTYIVADEAVYKELVASLVRVATTASSLEAEQDNGKITKTRSKETPNDAGSQGTTLGGSPRCQETMGDTIAQTGFENVSKHSNDSLLARGNTLRSDKDSLKLKELMELCTNFQQRVLDLEKIKTTQANEIDVKKL
ncbi:uncharacterized mitochondrial protein-like protein, partial [Tanacetum coccineum]